MSTFHRRRQLAAVVWYLRVIMGNVRFFFVVVFFNWINKNDFLKKELPKKSVIRIQNCRNMLRITGVMSSHNIPEVKRTFHQSTIHTHLFLDSFSFNTLESQQHQTHRFVAAIKALEYLYLKKHFFFFGCCVFFKDSSEQEAFGWWRHTFSSFSLWFCLKDCFIHTEDKTHRGGGGL